MTEEPTGRNSPMTRRFGYSVTIAIYVVSIWAAFNLVDWGWPPFLTDEWNDAVPYVAFAIGVNLAFTITLLFYDAEWYRSATQIVMNLAGLVAAVVVWQIWPFIFTDGGFPWEIIVRVGLALAVVGPIVGIISEAVKLVRRLSFEDDPVRHTD
ncbi:MAG: hypothetical protein ABFR53_12510 [Actinomycetota bacterium]